MSSQLKQIESYPITLPEHFFLSFLCNPMFENPKGLSGHTPIHGGCSPLARCAITFGTIVFKSWRSKLHYPQESRWTSRGRNVLSHVQWIHESFLSSRTPSSCSSVRRVLVPSCSPCTTHTHTLCHALHPPLAPAHCRCLMSSSSRDLMSPSRLAVVRLCVSVHVVITVVAVSAGWLDRIV